MIKRIGKGLLFFGMALTVYAFDAPDSVIPDVPPAYAGAPTLKTILLLLGGSGSVVFGAVMAFQHFRNWMSRPELPAKFKPSLQPANMPFHMNAEKMKKPFRFQRNRAAHPKRNSLLNISRPTAGNWPYENQIIERHN